MRNTESTLKTSWKPFTNTNVTMNAKLKLNHSKSGTTHSCSTPTITRTRTKPNFHLSIGSDETWLPMSYRIPTKTPVDSVLTTHNAYTECVSNNSTQSIKLPLFRQKLHSIAPIHMRQALKSSLTMSQQQSLDQLILVRNLHRPPHRKLKKDTNSSRIPMTLPTGHTTGSQAKLHIEIASTHNHPRHPTNLPNAEHTRTSITNNIITHQTNPINKQHQCSASNSNYSTTTFPNQSHNSRWPQHYLTKHCPPASTTSTQRLWQ